MLKTGLVSYLMNRFARSASPKSIETGIRSLVRNAENRTPELVEELLKETRRHSDGKDVFRQCQDEQYLLTRTRTNYLPLLPTIATPTLVINGERDTGTPVAAERLEGNPHPPLSAAYRVGVEILLADPLMTAAFLDDRDVLGSFADSVDDNRHRQRHHGLIEWIQTLQGSGQLTSDLDASALALTLSSTTIRLLKASRLLGPLDAEQLGAAITTMGQLIQRALEPTAP